MTPTGPARFPRRLAPVVGVLLLALEAGAAAQPGRPTQPVIEEESITELGVLDPLTAPDAAALRRIFDEAERRFLSGEEEAVSLFDRLIRRLQSEQAAGTLVPGLQPLLPAALTYRAEASLAADDRDSAERDLRRSIELAPGRRLDPARLSPQLIQLHERLLRSLVGLLVFEIEPPDARVTVEGEPLEVRGGEATVLAGRRRLRLTRPGYQGVELTLDIPPARRTRIEERLERLTAVLVLQLRPPEAGVLLDGVGAERFVQPAPDEPGAPGEVAIEVPEPGRHLLEIRHPGYRSFLLSLPIAEPLDYRLPPLALEPARGDLALAHLPRGAVVSIDGRTAEPDRRRDGTARLSLPPGDHALRVELGTVGSFETRVTVRDRETTHAAVALRPRLAFLGVLGPDPAGASQLAARLVESLSDLPDWHWLDRSIDSAELLRSAGVTAGTLAAVGPPDPAGGLDWSRVQRSVERNLPASLYLLATLDSASSARLWLWAPSPWPPLPAIRDLRDPLGAGSLAGLRTELAAPSPRRRVHLGAVLVDSGAAPGPLVAAVDVDGPLAAAGIVPGETLLELDGQPLSSRNHLLAALRAVPTCAAATGPESPAARSPATSCAVTLRVGAGAVLRDAHVALERPSALLSLTDSRPLDPALAAHLAVALLRPPADVPRWALELDRAAIYLRAGDFASALPLLRAAAPPSDATHAVATADYRLALALLAGPDPPADPAAARAALERVLAIPGARLDHADGPLLAPRARLRLRQLERTVRRDR